MKRRDVLKHLGVISIGSLALPGCQLESRPKFERIPLTGSDYTLLEHLCNAIFPNKRAPISFPEKTVDFVLTMLNDTYNDEDLREFLMGFTAFKTYLKESYRNDISIMPEDQQSDILQTMITPETSTESIRSFAGNLKVLVILQVETSKFFLEKCRDYHFASANYDGCSPLNQQVISTSNH